MKYLHSMIRVNDIEKSLKFYSELLGQKLQSKKDLDDCTLYFLAEYEGAPEIELTDNWEKPAKPYTNGETFGHFAFSCDDMDAFVKKATDLGVELLYGSPFNLDLKKEDGTVEVKRISFVKDPDGNEIEIIYKGKE